MTGQTYYLEKEGNHIQTAKLSYLNILQNMIKYVTLLIVKFYWIYICLIHIKEIQSMNE